MTNSLMKKQFLGDIFGIPVYHPFEHEILQQVAYRKHELMLLNSANNPLFYLEAMRGLDFEIDEATKKWGDQKFNFIGRLKQESNILAEKLKEEADKYLDQLYPNYFGDSISENIAVIEHPSEVQVMPVDYSVNILGVSISKPFRRSEIRELVKVKHQIMLERSKRGLNLHQEALDLNDAVQDIIEKWDINDRIDFLNLCTEETDALTNSINDKTTNVLIENANNEIENAKNEMVIQWIIGMVAMVVIFEPVNNFV